MAVSDAVDTGADVSEKLDEHYRMMCPEHHHNLVDQLGPTVYCKGCASAYRYEDLIDKKQMKSRSVVPAKDRIQR